MKKLLFLFAITLFLSCSNDDESFITEEVALTVNHYKVPSEFTLSNNFLVKEAGAEKFVGVPSIGNFAPQPGVVYEITATKTTTSMEGTNVTTVRYDLIDIISQTQVPASEKFVVPLARRSPIDNNVEFWITGNPDDGYALSGEIPIDCGIFCQSFDPFDNNNYQDAFSGLFEHAEDGSYKLIEFL